MGPLKWVSTYGLLEGLHRSWASLAVFSLAYWTHSTSIYQVPCMLVPPPPLPRTLHFGALAASAGPGASARSAWL